MTEPPADGLADSFTEGLNKLLTIVGRLKGQQGDILPSLRCHVGVSSALCLSLSIGQQSKSGLSWWD